MKGVRNLFGRFLSILSAKVLTTVIAFVSTPIVVRLLGPGGYGDYAVLLSIFSLYMIPVSSGVGAGVQKFVAESRDTDNWQEYVFGFYALLALVVVAIAVVVLLGFTVLGGAATVFGPEFAPYFYLLTGFVFVGQVRVLSMQTMLGFGLERITGPLKVVKKFVTIALGIALVLTGLDVDGMLLGHITANLVVALVGIFVIARHLSLDVFVPGEFSLGVLTRRLRSFPYREVMSFNGLNIVLVLLVMSLFHVDIVMLRVLVGPETTGFYKAALSLAEYLWIVPIVLQTILLHSSSTLWSTDQTERITRLSSRITRYTLLLVILMAVGLAALADRFIPLYYGTEFTVAITPLLLLLPGAVGFAVARPLQAISQGSGKMKVIIMATGGAAAINFTLNALLIPAFGMEGAAVATSVGYGSMFFFLVWAAHRIGYNPLADLRVVRIATTALLAGPPIYLLAMVFSSDILALVVVPPVGALLFTGVAFLSGALDVEEVADIFAKVPDPVGSALESGLSWVQ